MLRLVMGAVAALVLLGGHAQAAFVMADPQPAAQGGGGNFCTQSQAGFDACTFEGSSAILKANTNASGTQTPDKVNGTFASVGTLSITFTDKY